MQTPYQKNSETSRESAAILDNTGAADNQAGTILNLLRGAGVSGMTADEITVAMQTGGYPYIHNGTVAGRMVTLENHGKVVRAAWTRKTRAKRNANVYVHADYQDKVPILTVTSLSDLKIILRAIYTTLEAGETFNLDPHGPFHKLLKGYFSNAENENN